MYLNRSNFKRTQFTWIYSLLIFSVSTISVAAECSAKSGAQSTPLLELYTSEGCSSCPSADKWMSSIAGSGFTSDKVVPLAFHVDYWDYIGWKDRFGKAEYSNRQRQAAKHDFAAFVYTPQVTLNGTDFRGWQQGSRFSQALETSSRQPAKANLRINITSGETNSSSVSVAAQTIKPEDAKNLDAYIAVYENNLKSEVKAGENAGRQLKHDYVVRELYGPYRLEEKIADKQAGGWQRSLPLNAEWKNRDIGVAAFLQNRESGQVVQALSLKACL
ncbi:MAG: DUF1223 domain-containing protein [Methylophilaceae bacterium]